MDRRNFIKKAMAGAGIASLTPTALLSGCSQAPIRAKRGPGVDKLLFDGARVMWVAAHPDDESLIGSILAKASLGYQNPLYFLLLTHGEGGQCCRPQGCKPDLATVRSAEMKHVAELYHAELQHERLYNASLPVSSFPKRHEIAKLWNDEKDVTLLVAEAMRRFKPDLVFTFCPVNGFTGHPEHQITSRFVTSGVRMAADPTVNINGMATHRVSYVYYTLNRYWPLTVFMGKDEGPVTETWDATQYCAPGWECRDVMARFSRAHESQNDDMSAVRKATFMLKKIYLRDVDPFTEIYDPFEVRSDEA